MQKKLLSQNKDVLFTIATFCSFKDRFALTNTTKLFKNCFPWFVKGDLIHITIFKKIKNRNREIAIILEIINQTKDGFSMKQRITSLTLFESSCCGHDEDDIPYDKYLCNISKHCYDKLHYMSSKKLKVEFTNKFIKHCNKNWKNVVVFHYLY